MRFIRPNCAGTISLAKGFVAFMPPHIYTPGRVGIVRRSGTLGYEAASQMQTLGIMIGEIGAPQEAEAAAQALEADSVASSGVDRDD